VLVDPLQDVDELLAEQARGDADFAAQRASDLVTEVTEVVIVDQRGDPRRVAGAPRVQVPDAGAQLDQPAVVEPGEADLDGSWVVEAGVDGEVGGQTLGQRRQALGALGAVEERRRAGDDGRQTPAGSPAESSSHTSTDRRGSGE